MKVTKSKLPNPSLSSSSKLKEINRNLLVVHLPYHTNKSSKTELQTMADNFKIALNHTKIKIDRILITFKKH